MNDQQTGHIFNIQKFSLHDGPGIRTTIFFKGCNLHCRWCANPESQQMQTQLTLDMDKCVGCGRCTSVCKMQARHMESKFPSVDASRCSGCAQCVELCPTGAIGMEGKETTLEEVLQEALKDLPFYQQSGGGVTFSGGEVLMQQEFATALARALHSHGIHVAIETAATVSPERFQAFLQEIDYAYVDLKHYDSAHHREGTGVGNEQILRNISYLAKSGVSHMIRIPVIPGYNNSLKDAAEFAKLLTSLGVRMVQLLPFHPFGERKYALLGKTYAYQGQRQLHAEDLEEYRQTMIQHGLDARFQA